MLTRPKRLLDLFCGAGGAATGYHRAGFTEIVGVDIKPQKHYPFTFIQGDALEYVAAHGQEFDVIHASPPCQAYCALKTMPNRRNHPDLIGPVRDLFLMQSASWIIENVFGAPLRRPLRLCGSQFGLSSNGYHLRRHRYFEVSFEPPPSAPCRHLRPTAGVYGAKVRDIAKEKRHYGSPKATRGSPVGVVLPHEIGFGIMGIAWMNMNELSEAIPPAYTEFLGKWLMTHLETTS